MMFQNSLGIGISRFGLLTLIVHFEFTLQCMPKEKLIYFETNFNYTPRNHSSMVHYWKIDINEIKGT